MRVFPIELITLKIVDMPSKRNRNDKSNKGKSFVADVSTLLQRAQNCIDKMDGKGALLHLEEALKQQPDNLEVVDKTANVYMELGEDEKAFPVRMWISCNYVVACEKCKRGPRS